MKVSVVVGVKNGAASLQRCLDSIAAQTLGASGEWLCFLGCHDVFHDAGALQALVDAAEHAAGRARVIYGRINRITPSGVVAVSALSGVSN